MMWNNKSLYTNRHYKQFIRMWDGWHTVWTVTTLEAGMTCQKKAEVKVSRVTSRSISKV